MAAYFCVIQRENVLAHVQTAALIIFTSKAHIQIIFFMQYSISTVSLMKSATCVLHIHTYEYTFRTYIYVCMCIYLKIVGGKKKEKRARRVLQFLPFWKRDIGVIHAKAFRAPSL